MLVRMRRLAFVLLLCACERDAAKVEKTEKVETRAVAPAVAPMLPAHVDAVRAAASTYTKWGRVDERPNPAPTDCAPMGPDGKASQVRQSAAEDGPHGRKLYFLWASDRSAYEAKKVEQGFAIVKESFSAEIGR